MFKNARIGMGSRALVTLAVGMLLVAIAQAATPDRIYLFGDDPEESPSPGGPPNSNFGSLTLDSKFLAVNLSDAQDLSYDGSPVYFEADSGALARPGAPIDSYGLQFNGTDARLFGQAFGSPAQGDAVYSEEGAPNYTGITTRYMEGWVRPSGGAGTRRDVVNDTTQFSIFISANNTWGFRNGSAEVVSDSPANVNTWYHVFHRTFGAGGGAVLLVDGIAVAATPTGYNAGLASPADGMVFGSNIAQDANFFAGQMDDFNIGVAGNNSTEVGGMNWGPIDLLTDNQYIAQELAGMTNVQLADLTGNGMVGQADIDIFVSNWRRAQQVDGVTVGDLTSRAWGDYNMSGVVDFDDAYFLHSALIASGQGGLNFALLSTAIPEPASAALLLVGVVGATLWRRRRT